MSSLKKLSTEPLDTERANDSRYSENDAEYAILRVINEIDKGRTFAEVIEELEHKKDDDPGRKHKKGDPDNFAFLVRVSLIDHVRKTLQGIANIAPVDPNLRIINSQHVFEQLMQVPDMTANLPGSYNLDDISEDDSEKMWIQPFIDVIFSIRCKISNDKEIRKASYDRGWGSFRA